MHRIAPVGKQWRVGVTECKQTRKNGKCWMGKMREVNDGGVKTSGILDSSSEKKTSLY